MTFKLNWSRMKSFALIVIVIQLLTMAFFIASEYAVTSQDRTIFLQINPVDPNDVFKGDYVILNYDISDLRVYYFSSEDAIPVTNQQVYVTLENYYGYKTYSASNDPISNKFPNLNDPAKQVAVKGVVRNANNDQSKWDNRSTNVDIKGIEESYGENYQINMEYGIEQYYVEQGKGGEIEEAIRKNPNQAFAICKVDKDGNIRVTGLEINGVNY